MIERRRIVGKATAVAFSLDRAHWFRPRVHRFFKGISWKGPAAPGLSDHFFDVASIGSLASFQPFQPPRSAAAFLIPWALRS